MENGKCCVVIQFLSWDINSLLNSINNTQVYPVIVIVFVNTFFPSPICKCCQLWCQIGKSCGKTNFNFFFLLFFFRYAIFIIVSKLRRISYLLKIWSGAFIRQKNSDIWAKRTLTMRTNYKSRIFCTIQSKNASIFWNSIKKKWKNEGKFEKWWILTHIPFSKNYY